MSVGLYMDEHVHRAITVGLRLCQVDVLTVQEDGRAGIDDDEVLARATELRRALFTQDDDLLGEADRCRQRGDDFAGIIFAHQLNVPIGRCVRDLELIAKASSYEEPASSIEFLPL